MKRLEEVFEKVGSEVIFSFQLFGDTVNINNAVFVCFIVSIILIVLSALLKRTLKADNPGKIQVCVEWLVEIVNNLCKTSAGHHGKAFVPYIGTLLVFLGLANIIGLLNFIPGLHMYPPTKDINVTATLALISIIVVLGAGFRYKGLKGWAKTLIDPMPVVAPFKLMEYITKPLSLALRLFGNVFAAFIIMEIIYSVVPVPFVSSPFSAYFDIFDGVLQAFIFTYLTIVYIGEAVE
ncbi:MAG: F0F1 ATP synthase subunit A [Oscillospiraceae bacterium]|nr:F0F1 ATP synthase subunit A [Oscillospiraceae bacterium]